MAMRSGSTPTPSGIRRLEWSPSNDTNRRPLSRPSLTGECRVTLSLASRRLAPPAHSIARLAPPALSHWDTCRVVPPSLITRRYLVGDTRTRAPRARRQRASCSRCARPRSSSASFFSSPTGCSASCSSASPTSSSAACCIADCRRRDADEDLAMSDERPPAFALRTYDVRVDLSTVLERGRCGFMIRAPSSVRCLESTWHLFFVYIPHRRTQPHVSSACSHGALSEISARFSRRHSSTVADVACAVCWSRLV